MKTFAPNRFSYGTNQYRRHSEDFQIETAQNSVSNEKFITFIKNTHESMKGK